jgi:hypothetical protein
MLRVMLDSNGAYNAGRSAGSDVGPDIGALARVQGIAAIKRLVEILDGKDAAAAVEAAKALLDRGYGAPLQRVAFDGEGICVEVGTSGETAEPTVGRSNGEAPGA